MRPPARAKWRSEQKRGFAAREHGRRIRTAFANIRWSWFDVFGEAAGARFGGLGRPIWRSFQLQFEAV